MDIVAFHLGRQERHLFFDEVVNRRKAKQKPVKAAQLLQIASEVSKAQLAIYNLWIEHVIRPGLVEGAKIVKGAYQHIQELSGTKAR